MILKDDGEIISEDEDDMEETPPLESEDFNTIELEEGNFAFVGNRALSV